MADNSSGRYTGYNDALIWAPVSLASFAVLVTVVFSLLVKRRRIRLNCCFGAPGLLYPVDYFSGQPSRLLVAAALTGLWCHTLLVILIRPVEVTVDSGSIDLSRAVSVSIRFLWVFLLSLLYLPLLACASTPYRLLGLVTGSLYTTLLLGYMCLWGAAFHNGCAIGRTEPNPPDGVQSAIVLAGILPIYISLASVLLWYAAEIIRWAWKVRILVKEHSTVHVGSYNYVTSLLRNNRNTQSVTASIQGIPANTPGQQIGQEAVVVQKEPVKKQWSLYRIHKGFSYPLKLVVAVVGAAASVYELSLLTIYLLLGLTRDLDSQLSTLQDIGGINIISNDSNSTNFITTLVNHRGLVVTGLNSFIVAGPVLALLFCLIQAFFMTKRTRTHLLRAFQGDYGFVTKRVRLAPSFMITSAIKYPAFQISYYIWAWILYVLVVWFLGLLVAALVIIAVTSSGTIIALLLTGMIAGAINGSIQLLQRVMPRFIFIKKGAKTPKDAAITNRRLLHLTSYLVHTWNGIPGAASAGIRSILSISVGLAIGPRMDTVLLPKGTERLDRGHLTYLGFIYTEALHNNHIAHVFVDLVYNMIKKQHRVTDTTSKVAQKCMSVSCGHCCRMDIIMSDVHPTESAKEHHPRVCGRARQRWYIAYTLINNPSLKCLRKPKLSARETYMHASNSNGLTISPTTQVNEHINGYITEYHLMDSKESSYESTV